jgi:hypothetical protein
MKLRAGGRVIALGALSAGLGAGLVACFDLFHSTSGIVSACDLDAQACQDAGAQAEAAAGDAGTDFCSFAPLDAVAHAQHACAWLGACETPMGGNAFGTCMFDALLAYDCGANPNHLVRGRAHALWDCLWQVQSCGDVARCIFPAGPPSCRWNGVNFTACGSASGLQGNADVRIECLDVDGGLAVGENCALTGQTCAGDSTVGTCAGAPLDAGGTGCVTTECTGTRLHQCGGGGVDVGLDCADNGAGRCAGFMRPGDTMVDWIACVASGDAGCQATEAAQCTNGYATSCPSGVPEAVYCTDLLQVVGAPNGGCVAGNLSPGFDWTSPCVVDPPMCTGDSCDADGGLVGCARGAPYPLDCASQGLGPCQMVSTDVGTAMHAACTPM